MLLIGQAIRMFLLTLCFFLPHVAGFVQHYSMFYNSEKTSTQMQITVEYSNVSVNVFQFEYQPASPLLMVDRIACPTPCFRSFPSFEPVEFHFFNSSINVTISVDDNDNSLSLFVDGCEQSFKQCGVLQLEREGICLCNNAGASGKKCDQADTIDLSCLITESAATLPHVLSTPAAPALYTFSLALSTSFFTQYSVVLTAFSILDARVHYYVTVTHLSGPPQSFFINGTRCDDLLCTFSMSVNDTTRMTFYEDDIMRDDMSLFQQSRGKAVFSYLGCAQDLSDHECLSTQYSQSDMYDLCVCENALTLIGCLNSQQMNMSCLSTSTVPSTTTTRLTSTTSEPTTVTATTQSSTTMTTTTAATTTTTKTTTTKMTTKMTTTTEKATTTNTEPSTTTPYWTPSQQLHNLTGPVDLQNVTHVLSKTHDIVSPMKYNISGDDLYSISLILNNSASILNITHPDISLIFSIMDSVLHTKEHVFTTSAMEKQYQAPQRLLTVFNKVVVNSGLSQIDKLDGQYFGFSARKIDCSTNEEEIGLADTGTEFEALYGTAGSDRGDDVKISIPKSVLCRDGQATHSVFAIFRTRNLHQGDRVYRELNSKKTTISQRGQTDQPTLMGNTQPAKAIELLPPPACAKQTALTRAPVTSASILRGDGAVTRLDGDPTMTNIYFDTSKLLAPLHGRYHVTWWDVARGEWAESDECAVDWKSDRVDAKCPHLTDFTLVISGMCNDPSVCDTTLQTLGYVVNSLSIGGLFTVLLLSWLSTMRFAAKYKTLQFIRGDSRRDSLAHIYLVFLLVFYVVFTVFSDRAVSGGACRPMAAIGYALLLSCILMTIFQTFKTTEQFVVATSVKRALKFSTYPIFTITSSILVPIITTIFLYVFSAFFERQDGMCWVRPDFVIAGVVFPLTILLCNAIFCTVVVIWRLFPTAGSLRMTGGDRQLWNRIISIALMQFTLGMPWILQYLTLYAPNVTFWHYLFTIVNGSQGLILAFLFFYRRTRVYVSQRRRRVTGTLNETEVAIVSSSSSSSAVSAAAERRRRPDASM